MLEPDNHIWPMTSFCKLNFIKIQPGPQNLQYSVSGPLQGKLGNPGLGLSLFIFVITQHLPCASRGGG